jgi:hypothetical protein
MPVREGVVEHPVLLMLNLCKVSLNPAASRLHTAIRGLS